MSTILPHMVCGLSANLECMSEMCCTRLAENTGRKRSPLWHHRTTLSGCIFAAEACKVCGVEQRAPPIFGRAAITFGIGSHSSLFCYDSPRSSATGIAFTRDRLVNFAQIFNRAHSTLLVMAALRSGCGHYIFALWFLSSSFFIPRLISAVADWMFTILRHMMWPYCEFRMHVWNVLYTWLAGNAGPKNLFLVWKFFTSAFCTQFLFSTNKSYNRTFFLRKWTTCLSPN